MTLRQSQSIFIAVFMVFALGLSSFGTHPLASAQESTPAAEDAPDSTLHFGLIPVGNHPQGYFSNVPANPGESITLEVAVINFGTVPVDLRVYHTNARNGLNGGFSPGGIDEEPIAHTNWVEFPQQEFHLEPAAQLIIPFIIAVPEGTAPGQYISTIAAEMTSDEAIEGTTMFTQRHRYAISVGVLVPGELQHSFELGEPVIDGEQLSIPITNTGNYLVQPQGQLTLTDSAGTEVISAPITMGSVYSGNQTSAAIFLPAQFPFGEYSLNLELTDPESGATAAIENHALEIAEPEDPEGIYLREYAIEPNAEEIVFANVRVLLENGGGSIDSANVILEVLHNGEVVEAFPMATNQTLVTGDNELTARYLPEEMWKSGTYTFRLTVSAVDPEADQSIELLTEPLDVEIVVP